MKQYQTAARRLAALLLAALLLATPALAAVPALLMPGGNTVGLKLYTEGLLVAEVADGAAAQTAGLRAGDTILAADGEAVCSAQELVARIQAGEGVLLTVRRGQQETDFYITPEKTQDGYRIGVSLRDHIAGIGTVTYYDPETKCFGALGHGVGAVGGTQLAGVTSGFVVSSSVASVCKGSRGTPGMLKGIFDLSRSIGAVTANCESGVFGVMQTLPHKALLPVALPEELHTGAAKILSNVDGTEVREYEIEILKLYPDAKNGRNLLLRVTDPALLEKTGGIVQGMSGSPIVQDGKLAGAVTHVLVNDPERGYGIFLENMLDAAAQKAAAA